MVEAEIVESRLRGREPRHDRGFRVGRARDDLGARPLDSGAAGPPLHQRLERAHQAAGRRPAPFGVLLETALDDPVEVDRDVGHSRGEWRLLLVQDLVEDGGDLGGAERALERQQLVGEDAEGEDVGARVHRLTADLLRREVGRGAERDAGLGQVRLVVRQLGDAEVEDLGGAVVEDADVRRLDVAVDDAPRVRELEPARDLHQPEDLLRQRDVVAALDLAIEVLARQVLLDEVRDVRLEAELEDGDDVAVLQVAGDLGLAPEPLARLGVLHRAGLDRDVALDEGVEPLVDDAEATDPDLLDDLVLAELLHGGPRRPCR